MQSASLSFNIPLFKKQAKRFWPLWGLYTFLLIMMLPVAVFLQGQNHYMTKLEYANGMHNYLLQIAASGASWISLFFAILIAMGLWSYLYNNRSVSMIHALPLSRGTLYLTNFLSGLIFALLPHLVVFLLTMGALALTGALTVAMKALLLWLLCQSLLFFFFFSFATLLAFVTGHIVALPCLYGIFNILTFVVVELINLLLGIFVYGFAYGSLEGLTSAGSWGSPMVSLTMHLSTNYMDPGTGNGISLHQLQGLSTVFIYAVVGLVLAVLAFLLYRKRKLELSGEIVVVPYLRPIFQYGVAICAGLSIGSLFFELFRQVIPQNIGSLLFFVLLWALVGFYAAEMLLRKTFRIRKESWKGAAALLVAIAVILLAMEWDVTGFERRVPKADDVVEVIQVGVRKSTKDPETIQAVLSLHESLVLEKKEIERRNIEITKNMRSGNYYMNETYVDEMSWQTIQLEYKLKSGGHVKRQYSIPASEELLGRADSPAAQYQALLNLPDWTLDSYFPEQVKPKDLTQIEISIVEKDYGDGIQFSNRYLSGEEAQKLFQAVREDMKAGRLGKECIGGFNSEFAENNYVNTIYFSFRGDYNMTDNTRIGHYYEGFRGASTMQQGASVGYDVALPLQKSASATFAVLKELGFEDGKQLLSEQEAYGVDYKDSEETFPQSTGEPLSPMEESEAIG